MNTSENRRKFFITFLKLAVSAIAIYWLLSGIDLKATARILSSINPWLIIAVIIVHTAASLLGGIRWWLLFRHTSKSISFSRVLPSFYIGMFFNNVLPSSVGGDVVRILHLRLRGMSAKALVGSSIVDRAVGLFVVLLVGSASLMITPDIALSRRDQIVILALVVGAIVGVLIFFSPWFERILKHLAQRYRGTRIRGFLLETVDICHSYRHARSELFIAVVLTLVLQSLVVVTYYVLARGIGIDLSPTAYFAIVPIVFIAASVPISFGGLGVREGALVVVMAAMGVETQAAAALSLIYLLVLWVTCLPGGVIFLLNKRTTRNHPPLQPSR